MAWDASSVRAASARTAVAAITSSGSSTQAWTRSGQFRTASMAIAASTARDAAPPADGSRSSAAAAMRLRQLRQVEARQALEHARRRIVDGAPGEDGGGASRILGRPGRRRRRRDTAAPS